MLVGATSGIYWFSMIGGGHVLYLMCKSFGSIQPNDISPLHPGCNFKLIQVFRQTDDHAILSLLLWL